MPTLEINLAKIRQNTANLVKALGAIELAGVIKACQGNIRIAQAFVEGGVQILADVHLQNFVALKKLPVKKMLLRAPLPEEPAGLLSLIDFISVSSLSDINRLRNIAADSEEKGLIVNIETGFGREGFEPDEIEHAAELIARTKGVYLAGFATNTACANGQNPLNQLNYFTAFVNSTKPRGPVACEFPDRIRRNGSLRAAREPSLRRHPSAPLIISGGNSSILPWALRQEIPKEINQLRIGEAILLGHDTASYKAIANNSLDAFRLKVEVVGRRQTNGSKQAVLATGLQDIGAGKLTAIGDGKVNIEKIFSDNLTISFETNVTLGKAVWFRPDYYALLALMTSPYIKKRFIS